MPRQPKLVGIAPAGDVKLWVPVRVRNHHDGITWTGLRPVWERTNGLLTRFMSMEHDYQFVRFARKYGTIRATLSDTASADSASGAESFSEWRGFQALLSRLSPQSDLTTSDEQVIRARLNHGLCFDVILSKKAGCSVFGVTGTLPGLLVYQAVAEANARRPAVVCSACGRLYRREKSPPRGRANFCKRCRRTVADALRKRWARARLKNGATQEATQAH